jgi:adenosylcobinamide-phosphate synthase
MVSPKPDTARLLRTVGLVGSAVLTGVMADLAVGEPPSTGHPVALFGRGMQRLEEWSWADDRWSGVGYSLVGVGLAAALGALLAGAGPPPGPARLRVTRRWLALAGSTYAVVAARALGQAASDVAQALAEERLDLARDRLSSLVGRDPRGLEPAEVARAVVESVAENSVDAVVAPVLWALAAGAPGALGYRAANTLDAMVGHRSARYERFGWASARLDDLANWVPARVCAALVAAARPRSAAAVWRVVRRDAGAHPSPNAGVVEAAFAAALGLRLGGLNRYGDRVESRPVLGDGRPAEADDIAAAVRLSRDVTAALLGLIVSGTAAAVAASGRPGDRRTRQTSRDDR